MLGKRKAQTFEIRLCLHGWAEINRPPTFPEQQNLVKFAKDLEPRLVQDCHDSKFALAGHFLQRPEDFQAR